MKCSVCASAFTAMDSAPFCSDRCRLVDLGNWLGGRYCIPDYPDQAMDESDAFESG